MSKRHIPDRGLVSKIHNSQNTIIRKTKTTRFEEECKWKFVQISKKCTIPLVTKQV
jgi:hypothetical protein